MDSQRLQVFVVTAEPGLVHDVSRLLMNLRVGVDLHQANDAPGAARSLRSEGEFARRARPDLVLIDLDIGKQPVQEILSVVASADELARLPVVALARDPASAVSELSGFRIHDVLSKPPIDDEITHLISYFDEI